MDLTTPIKEAGFVFKLKANALQRLNITTLEDLLFHLPFRYEDYTNAVKIKDLVPFKTSVIKATVLEIKNEYTRRHFVLQKAIVSDETSNLTCMWFNQAYITRVIKSGDTVGLVGKLDISKGKPTFQVKDYEILDKTHGIHTNGLVPVYSETRGISSKWLRNRVYELLQTATVEDFLPNDELEKLKFPRLFEAIRQCHFPENLEMASSSRERLAFDELLIAQIAALKRKNEWNTKNKGIPFKTTDYKLQTTNFINSLPFELTPGQKNAVEEITKDLQKDVPMNRLLEGDVGSGKTVVATIAMYISFLNGYQSVIMAPTEILAVQHYNSITKLLTPLGISIGLKTSSMYQVSSSKGEEKMHNTKYIIQNTDVLIGTHALIQKGINFEKLGLVIIDEQQRFGVEQRSILREKAKNPHFLTMTATPIPRTILLALYKDLDVSLLKDMPQKRLKVKTWLVPPVKRKSAYNWIKEQIVKSDFKDQAFIVCPFIEESESMNTVKAAKTEFEKLQSEDFKDLKLGLLHGKLKAKEKNEILNDFKDKKIQILVSTPVVEVGIDIPDATIMVIEAADRFGLSQLHQLRGRVGRGNKQSFCLLFTESESSSVITRLKFMEQAHSGFELAELDLKMRGPGDMYGTRQHGIAGFKIADFSNSELTQKAKEEAENLLPKLSKLNLLAKKIEKVELTHINPD